MSQAIERIHSLLRDSSLAAKTRQAIAEQWKLLFAETCMKVYQTPGS